MDIAVSTFQDRVMARARRERRPLNCLFEITPTCNLRCQFCYVALDPYKGPYLTTAQISEVLEKIERAGVLWLTLTGGEIFSRRDFEAIYRDAIGRGLLVSLYTNATMVRPEHADLLAAVPPYSVEVSVYGADAEHYETTTQIPGSFARFERGLDLLQRAGVNLTLKCPISTFTADHVAALHEYAKRRGLALQLDPTVDARHDGGTEPHLYRIEPRDVKRIRDEVHVLATGKRRDGPLPDCRQSDGAHVDELYYCGAGRTGFFIDAMGRASHCVIDRDPVFPILEMPWEDLWAQMGAWVTQPLPADAPCSGCGMRGGCENCPARSRLATGSPYLRDSYLCEVTHHEFGVQRTAKDTYRTQSVKRPLGACAV